MLFACGFLIQQTALADFASIASVPCVAQLADLLLVVGGTFVLTVAVVIIPFVISASVHNVWFALVTSYVDYLTNDALGDRPRRTSRAGV